MSIVIIVFCLLMYFVGYIIEKNVYNPLCSFNMFWGGVVALSSLELYNLNQVSDTTYFIIFLGIFSFNIGFFYFNFIYSNKYRFYKNTQLEKNLYALNYKVFSIMLMIGIIFSIIITYRVFFMIFFMDFTIHEIRSFYTDVGTGVFNSAWDSVFWGFYVRPLLYVSMAILVLEIFNANRNNKIILLIIIYILLNLTDGGRVIFYYFLVMLLWMMLINRQKLRISKKQKRIFKYIVVICFCLGFFITIQRGTDANQILKQLYIYFAGSVPHLQYRLSIISLSNVSTNGAAFFSGILSFVFLVLKQIGINPTFWEEYIRLSNVQDFVRIGENIDYNAFVTPFFYFYLDGKYIGVILGSLLYGLISSLAYFKLKFNHNIYTLSVYLLIIMGIMTSMVRWQFSQPQYLFAFLLLPLIFKKKKF